MTTSDILALAIAALGGAAMGVERQWFCEMGLPDAARSDR
jgi:hypothetical protein